jgi:hypothetical protein
MSPSDPPFLHLPLASSALPPLPPAQCSSPGRRCAATAAPPPVWSASTRHSPPIPVLFPLSAVLFCTRHDHPSLRRPPHCRRRVSRACLLYFPPPSAQQHQQLILDPFPRLFPLPCAPRAPIASAARSSLPVRYRPPWTATIDHPLPPPTP